MQCVTLFTLIGPVDDVRSVQVIVTRLGTATFRLGWLTQVRPHGHASATAAPFSFSSRGTLGTARLVVWLSVTKTARRPRVSPAAQRGPATATASANATASGVDVAAMLIQVTVLAPCLSTDAVASERHSGLQLQNETATQRLGSSLPRRDASVSMSAKVAMMNFAQIVLNVRSHRGERVRRCHRPCRTDSPLGLVQAGTTSTAGPPVSPDLVPVVNWRPRH